jgi:hypothetical protein
MAAARAPARLNPWHSIATLGGNSVTIAPAARWPPSRRRHVTALAAAAAASSGGDRAAAAAQKLPMQQRILNGLLNVSNVPYRCV